jgi:hypothetical protein
MEFLLDHGAFERSRSEAEDVIEFTGLERASCEKPVPTFFAARSRRAGCIFVPIERREAHPSLTFGAPRIFERGRYAHSSKEAAPEGAAPVGKEEGQ